MRSLRTTLKSTRQQPPKTTNKGDEQMKTKVNKIEPSSSGRYVQVWFTLPSGDTDNECFTVDEATEKKIIERCLKYDKEAAQVGERVEQLNAAFGLSSSLVEAE